MLFRASLGDVLRVARKASRSVRLSCALGRQRDAFLVLELSIGKTSQSRGICPVSRGVMVTRAIPNIKTRPNGLRAEEDNTVLVVRKQG